MTKLFYTNGQSRVQIGKYYALGEGESTNPVEREKEIKERNEFSKQLETINTLNLTSQEKGEMLSRFAMGQDLHAQNENQDKLPIPEEKYVNMVTEMINQGESNQKIIDQLKSQMLMNTMSTMLERIKKNESSESKPSIPNLD